MKYFVVYNKGELIMEFENPYPETEAMLEVLLKNMGVDVKEVTKEEWEKARITLEKQNMLDQPDH